VLAVAEWFIGRSAAAAKGDVRLACGDLPSGPSRIDHGDRTFYQQRAIIADTNANVRHYEVPLVLETSTRQRQFSTAASPQQYIALRLLLGDTFSDGEGKVAEHFFPLPH